MLKKDTLVSYIISILGKKTHSVSQGFVPKDDGSMETVPVIQPYSADWGVDGPPDELKHLIEAIAEGVVKHIQKDAEFSFNTVCYPFSVFDDCFAWDIYSRKPSSTGYSISWYRRSFVI